MDSLTNSNSLSDMHRFAFSALSVRERMAAGIISLLCLASMTICFIYRSFATSMLYILCILFAAVFLIFAMWFYRHEAPLLFKRLTPISIGLSVLGISIIGGVVLELLTLIGSPLSTPFDLSAWGKKRVLIFSSCCFVLITLALRLQIRRNVILEDASKNEPAPFVLKWGLPGLAAITLSILLVSSILTGVWSWRYEAFAQRLVFLIMCAAIIVLLLFSIRRTIISHPESAFLVLALSVGSFLCIALPPITGISFDDQIHYDRGLGLSYLGQSEYSTSDVSLVTVPWVHDNVIEYSKLNSTIESLEASVDDLNNGENGLVRNGFFTPVAGSSLLSVSTIGYIPSAIGLWLARLIGLGFSGSVILGRWANLICYAMVYAYAVRFIPSKKVLLATVGLLPTSIYFAANFSYDPWLTAFLALGFALIFREISLHRTLSAGSFFTALAVLIVGLCPKAIYFPVLGLFFLFPRYKFSSNRKRIIFYIATVAAAILIIATFLLPMFDGGGQGGDARGGVGISAFGQITYILSHPIEYIATMGNFLLLYLSPVQSNLFTTDYPLYIGDLTSRLPWLSTWLFIVLIVVSMLDITDNFKSIKKCRCGRVWIFIIFITTIILVATSLYITFTPVGSATVEGCQPRYLLPVIFLCLCLIRPKSICLSKNQSYGFVLYPLISCTLVSLANLVYFVVYI